MLNYKLANGKTGFVNNGFTHNTSAILKELCLRGTFYSANMISIRKKLLCISNLISIAVLGKLLNIALQVTSQQKMPLN